MASSFSYQAWCGHGRISTFSSVSQKPRISKAFTRMLAASSPPSSFAADSQATIPTPAPKRFSHLSPLLSQLLSASSTDIPLVLEPWLHLLSADDWNVLIADVGRKSWTHSLQIFNTFTQKSPLWHDLRHQNKASGETTPELLKICTTVVRVLGRKQRKEEIGGIQEQMKEADIVPDTSFYNALFVSYADYGHTDEISQGLLQMEAAGIKPDYLTYEALITAYLRGESPELDMPARILKDMIKEGLPVSANTFRKLINAFWEAEDVEGTEKVFTLMQDAGHPPDLKVIMKLMQLHGRKGNHKRNLELFTLLKNSGIKQTDTAYGFLLHAYCKAGLMKQAREMFRNFETGFHEEALRYYADLCNSGLEADVVSYCSIISALVKVGRFKKAEQLYKRMLAKGIQPNLHIYLTMIHCYTKCKATRLGRELYFAMRKSRIKMTDTAYSTILALYVEGRWYDHAAAILKRLEREGFNLDTAAHGLLIRSFGKLDDDIAPLAQGVEASDFGVCKLLRSLALTKRGGLKMDSKHHKLIAEFFESLENGEGNGKTISIYNAFLDCFWQRGFIRTAQILLEKAREVSAANTRPRMHSTKWVLDVRGLSVGGSKVAVADWLNRVEELNSRGLLADKKMVIMTGVGDFPQVGETEDVDSQGKGLKVALLSMLQGLGSPFAESPENPKALQSSATDVLKWVSGGALKQELSLVDCC
eukprot:c21363_g1_i2 orf=428-2539(-)